MTTRLQQLNEEFQTIKKRFRDEGQALLKEAFSDFFTAHPIAKAIVWAQYTPYFNDGEPCTFGVRDYELRVDPSDLSEGAREKYMKYHKGEDPIAARYHYGELSAVGYTVRDEPGLDGLRAAFSELTSALSDEVLLATFGDHCVIRATPAGFEVDEYNHD